MGWVSVLWGRRARRWGFRAVFAVSMTLALLAYGVPLWYHVHGQRILVVTSGSMAPTFNAGDAVVITKISPSELRPGQVVTFWPIAKDARLTTHRIINLLERPDLVHGETTVLLGPDGKPQMSQYIQTQGDANSGPDYDLTPVSNVRGAVTGVKRGWGYPLGYAHSPLGRLLIFAPPLVLLLLAELLSWRGQRRARPAGPQPREKRDALVTPA